MPRGFHLGAVSIDASADPSGGVSSALLLYRRNNDESLHNELQTRTLIGAPALAVDHKRSAAAFPFSLGVSLAEFLERQNAGGGGGLVDEHVACAVIAALASRIADVHRKAKHRVGQLDDERVWLGFDGTVSLVGPFDIDLVEPEFAGLRQALTIDVWRLGAMAAALLSGIRPVPRSQKHLPPGNVLTWEGMGRPHAATLPAATRSRTLPLIERALTSADNDDAFFLAAGFASIAASHPGGAIDATRELAHLLAGLFPEEARRAREVLEELALATAAIAIDDA